jgi:hypothetical protein
MKPAALAVVLLAASLSCAPPFEPSYPSGQGWRCTHALPPAETPSGLTFEDYASGSRCFRSQSKCERMRAGALANTGLRFVARFRRDEPPPRPEGASPPRGQGLCDIEPRACPLFERTELVRPAGFSACEERPEATCSASHREPGDGRGEVSWSYTCFARGAECESHLELWGLHEVRRPCVTLR